MLIRYTHRNGHEELIELPTPPDILRQIHGDPSLWPRPTAERPDDDALAEMMADGDCEATDGCTVDPDGICPHGHVSWLMVIAREGAPIIYRGYEISPDRDFPARWAWVHPDYNGPGGPGERGDPRCGSATSIERAKAEIDDCIEEYGAP
jgi:hypothetical protein